ncbi:MAG TPA: MFS transporter [Humisphaera sp.]|jgi:MFS family permease|nr:MFS transporter [Humisphaera sp.]
MPPSESSSSRRGGGAMWVAAAEMAAIYLISTIPTPLYAIYQERFGFSQIMLTLIYAVYVVGTTAAMFFLGRVSDQIGRRPVVLVSLGIVAASAFCFIAARGVVWLFAARALSGLAIALASGATAAWILELEPAKDKARAARITTAANLLGLGVGALAAGLLAEYAPSPLVLSYVVFLVVLLPISWLSARLPETIKDAEPMEKISMRPRIGVPRDLWMRFLPPAVAAFAVLSVMGFYSALIPTLLSGALQNKNHAVAGAVVAELFVLGTFAVASFPQLGERAGLMISLALLLPSIGALLASEAMHSMWLLIAATVIGGVSTAVGFQYSLEAVNKMAPKEKRSEIISMYMIFCYAGVSLPVVGIGVLSTWMRPLIADAIFAGVVGVLVIASLIGGVMLARKDS